MASGSLAAAAAAVVGLLLASCTRSDPSPDRGGAPIKVLTCTVQPGGGSARLIVRGSDVRVEPDPDQPARTLETKVFNQFPRSGTYHADLQRRTPSNWLSVVKQPGPDNGFELQVMVAGGPTSRPVTFDVYAVPTAEFENRFNVVVITIDTLRPDRLGCYGHSRLTSPNLDRFAEQSVRFTNAFSTSSFTPPAHASLFTSKYPGDHGLLGWNRLPDDQVTLAEVLKGCGFVTAASVNLDLLTEQNLGQGFDWQGEGRRDGRLVVADGIRFIHAPADSPKFVWLHFYDVHRPYGGPPDSVRRFNPGGRDGVGDDEPHYNLRPLDNPEHGYSLKASGLDEADLEFITDRYDAGIAYVDALLGPVFEALSTPQRQQDTMVVVTSDHGENLREHPEFLFSHDPYLHSVVTHIPLLIRYPGARGGGSTTNALVSLIDVAPTVLEVIGAHVPSEFNEGRSLMPLLKSDTDWPRQEIFMESWSWKMQKAVRSAGHLAILEVSNAETQFFALANDPLEHRPALQPGSGPGARLQELLKAFSRRPGANAAMPELDEQTKEKLRSLGYTQ